MTTIFIPTRERFSNDSEFTFECLLNLPRGVLPFSVEVTTEYRQFDRFQNSPSPQIARTWLLQNLGHCLQIVNEWNFVSTTRFYADNITADEFNSTQPVKLAPYTLCMAEKTLDAYKIRRDAFENKRSEVISMLPKIVNMETAHTHLPSLMMHFDSLIHILSTAVPTSRETRELFFKKRLQKYTENMLNVKKKIDYKKRATELGDFLVSVEAPTRWTRLS